jgi:acetyltransferase-like isoleucine patch superfamily enzyme
MQKSTLTKNIQGAVNRVMGIESRFRVFFYSRFFSIGEETIILSGFKVRNPEKIKIGKRGYININCFMQGSGGVEIGDDVIIGPNVSFYSENHNFLDKKKLIKDQGFTRKKIIVGNDVWLGANVTILPGISLGDGCVVGAGAIVTKSFPSYSVIAGVPAKKIKERRVA